MLAATLTREAAEITGPDYTSLGAGWGRGDYRALRGERETI